MNIVLIDGVGNSEMMIDSLWMMNEWLVLDDEEMFDVLVTNVRDGEKQWKTA